MRTDKTLWADQKRKSALTDAKIISALATGPKTFGEIRNFATPPMDASLVDDHCKRLIKERKIGKHYNRASDRREYFLNEARSIEYLEAFDAEIMEHHRQLGGTIMQIRTNIEANKTGGAIEPTISEVNAARKRKN